MNQIIIDVPTDLKYKVTLSEGEYEDNKFSIDRNKTVDNFRNLIAIVNLGKNDQLRIFDNNNFLRYKTVKNIVTIYSNVDITKDYILCDDL